ERRWVYLHYFKDGQPSINWLDPTFAGMRLVMGDALHSLTDLGSGGLRLDANGFLGVEARADQGPAWSEGHPLSQGANQLIGSMVRKVGGFTFQELNLSMEDIVATGSVGPDLSYDFVTRPACQYALLAQDTEFLKITLKEAIRVGIVQASLVHALQNHDELTYELVHFDSEHGADEFSFGGDTYTGKELAKYIRADMTDRLTGENAPYNATFVENGITCTTVSLIAAYLGIKDLDSITAEQKEEIIKIHLLLVMFNAWQPGVLALSGWDLVGALPLKREQIPSLIASGDTRWLERGAYDLMGWCPVVETLPAVPKAISLYGSLPDQLADPNSFVSRLAKILKVRKAHGISTGELLDIPDSPHQLLIMVNRLAIGAVQITVLNFGPEPLKADVMSEYIPAGTVVDLANRSQLCQVSKKDKNSKKRGFSIELSGYGGSVTLIREER
ncbi:MAG: trehalose synthase, partial [Actinomycetales bacterium]